MVIDVGPDTNRQHLLGPEPLLCDFTGVTKISAIQSEDPSSPENPKRGAMFFYGDGSQQNV